LKVLEAFAAKRALVSTPVGVEGLEVEGGREVLLEEDPEAFAAAVVRLFDDRGLRARLAGAGRELAEQRYDWRILGERLAAILEELVV
jgi:glycosyltransferase involved in cell wall biosynthesis